MKGRDFIKNKKVKLLFFGILFFIMMNVSGIYALTNQTDIGSFSTGIVDIQIQKYELNDENEIVIINRESQNVLPGEVISFIPIIKNQGENCFIRVKIDYIDDNYNLEDYITNFSEDLIKYNDYYYYNKVLTSGEEIKLFDTIKIPSEISNVSEENLVLSITAEAIQENNFEPDFESNNPWKDVEPQKSINNIYNINTNKDESKITIEYENNTEEDILVSDEFLKILNSVMPGDKYSQTVNLKNNKNKNTNYYLSIKVDDKYLKEKELLSNLNFIIKNQKGKEIYNGKIIDKGNILLGNYDSNESDEFEFQIIVPNELGNEYNSLNPNFDLIFSADSKEDIIEDGGTESKEKDIADNQEQQNTDGNTPKNNLEGKNAVDKKTKKNPITGDSIDLSVIIFFISSIGLIIVIILAYKEKRNK